MAQVLINVYVKVTLTTLPYWIKIWTMEYIYMYISMKLKE